jgi:hypothetical protein
MACSGLTVDDQCSYFVLMESSRRFKPPWNLVRENSECYVAKDANGVTLAWFYCREDTQRYSFGVGKVSSDHARRIGKAIARIPEFMMPCQGFYPRGGGLRWRGDRPYHVALEDHYIREQWDEIDALCRFNSLPFNATGEVIENDGVWRDYEFTLQMKCDPVLGALRGVLAASFTFPSGQRICRHRSRSRTGQNSPRAMYDNRRYPTS